MNVQQALNEVFCEVFDNNAIRIGRETTADDIEGWDSLSHVNLMVAVEMKFNARFTVAAWQGLKNVGDLIDLIEKLMPRGET